jgi:hypothetical protein
MLPFIPVQIVNPDEVTYPELNKKKRKFSYQPLFHDVRPLLKQKHSGTAVS